MKFLLTRIAPAKKVKVHQEEKSKLLTEMNASSAKRK
jgi:hypothetical protein